LDVVSMKLIEFLKSKKPLDGSNESFQRLEVFIYTLFS